MKPYQTGQRVIVLDHLNTYDTYQDWRHIDKVPNFQVEALPENGKEYQITFIEYCDGQPYRMVLDNTFIVNDSAFREAYRHTPWAEYMCYTYE